MNAHFNANYWEQRWQLAQTQWDLGVPSPCIMEFASSIVDKNVAILIPGCGNAYEAEALSDLGFTNITLIDISETLVTALQEKYASNQHIQVLLGDFFKHEGKYNVIFEQTFFCALDPELRKAYVQQMHNLLKPEARLVGVLFNRTFDQNEPPFGGSINEYQSLFEPLFTIDKLENCYNSITPRMDTEVFINLKKI